MTRYEQLTSMSLEEFANWIDESCQLDNSPWMNWFDESYCMHCESVTIPKEETLEKLGFELMYGDSTHCAYCEVNDHCKFFPDRNALDNKEVITMWLKEKI